MRRLKEYIYQKPAWPNFTWDKVAVNKLLIAVKRDQGYLLGKMGTLGFEFQKEAVFTALTEDVIKSSEIEGEMLDKEQVRSSVARQLGLDIGGGVHVDRDVEGVVEMMLDATQNYNKKITQKRLLAWHASLFPSGQSGLRKITVGKYRTGPMEVVSGPLGNERVHYVAPKADLLKKEMAAFFEWLDSEKEYDDIIAAAVAHLWFITIHPFDDGNGRIARALSDLFLARSEDSPQRFYSMSAQIRAERSEYYDILEKTQQGDLDITKWLIWFLQCTKRAIAASEYLLETIYKRVTFWQKVSGIAFNERQLKILRMLLADFKGNLTSSKWAKLCKCSQDSASRDINDLVDKKILKQVGGGRSTHYLLAENYF